MKFCLSLILAAVVVCGLVRCDWDDDDSEEEIHQGKFIKEPKLFDNLFKAQNGLNEKLEETMAKIMYELEPMIENESIKIERKLQKIEPKIENFASLIKEDVLQTFGQVLSEFAENNNLTELLNAENLNQLGEKDIPKLGKAADDLAEKVQMNILNLMPKFEERIEDLKKASDDVLPEMEQDLNEFQEKIESVVKPVLAKNLEELRKSYLPPVKDYRSLDTAIERQILPKIEEEAKSFWQQLKNFYVDYVKEGLAGYDISGLEEQAEVLTKDLNKDNVDQLKKNLFQMIKEGSNELFETIKN